MAQRVGSVFSCVGGLDLAVLSVFGGEVEWHAEIDPAGCVLGDLADLGFDAEWIGLPASWRRSSVAAADALAGLVHERDEARAEVERLTRGSRVPPRCAAPRGAGGRRCLMS